MPKKDFEFSRIFVDIFLFVLLTLLCIHSRGESIRAPEVRKYLFKHESQVITIGILSTDNSESIFVNYFPEKVVAYSE
jgi:hypothetical protein